MTLLLEILRGSENPSCELTLCPLDTLSCGAGLAPVERPRRESDSVPEKARGLKDPLDRPKTDLDICMITSTLAE